MNYDDLPAVSDVPRVAKILGCSTDAVRTLITSGQLDHVRIGRLIRIPRHMLVGFLEGEDAAADTATPPVVNLSAVPAREVTL